MSPDSSANSRPIGITGVLALAVLAACYAYWCAGPELGGLGGDNAVYLLTGQHYSPWLAENPVARATAQHSQYPPLLPMLLGISGSASDPRMAHFVMGLGVLGALVALAGWARACGTSALGWLGLPIVFALMPGTYLQALIVNSETLYLLLSLGALWALARERAEPARRANPWLAAVCIGLALLTRTAATALWIGALVYLVRWRRWRAAAWVAASALPALGWNLLIPKTRSDGYLDDWVSFLGTPEPEILYATLARALDFLSAGFEQHAFGHLPGVSVLATTLLLTAGVACIARAARGEADGYYGLVYAAMMLAWGIVWPTTVSRLLFPLIPVLLFQLHWLVGCLAHTGIGRRSAVALQITVLAVWCIGALPFLSHAVGRLLTPLPEHLESQRRVSSWFGPDEASARAILDAQAALVSALREVAQHVEPDQCVLAVKPSLVAWYAERISYRPPLQRVDAATFETELDTPQCRYALGLNWATPTFSRRFYPLDRLGEDAQFIEAWQPTGAPAPIAVLVRIKR